MIVLPWRRVVGLRALVAPSRAATVPMFDRTRPSRTLDRREFRKRPVAIPVGEAVDPLAHRQAGCAVAQSHDHAGQLVSWD